MTKEKEDFRMGALLDHEHTIRLLEVALAIKKSPYEVLYQLIDVNWALVNKGITNDK